MEDKIMAADEAVDAAQAALSDTKVISNHEKMSKACQVLEQAQAESAKLYARWDELESMQS